MRTHPKDSFQRPLACSTSLGEKKSSTRPENRVDAARYDDSQLLAATARLVAYAAPAREMRATVAIRAEL